MKTNYKMVIVQKKLARPLEQVLSLVIAKVCHRIWQPMVQVQLHQGF